MPVSTASPAAPKAQPALKGLARPVIVSAVLFCLITGIAYPLLTTGVANLVFPHQAQGSLILHDGKPIGSALIGQEFTAPQYFHGRPSATTGVDPSDPSKTISQPYNAALSGASNKGPTNQKLIDDVAARARAYRMENGLPADAPVPVDAVTASASGLDPDISLANARLQAARVAKARHMPLEHVLALLAQHTTPRQFGLLGVPRVNVLALNLSLDRADSAHTATH
ncbi:potassium-transporting ATPase subunit KdpC [Halothiobacillus sp. 15-55-196]|jgi:K+-transporting ATPase ATPase C chain|uniref:potassium-transporting ATPase subunit KdpC n=1 Tax=Halothiobacillus sp. 15-55-196 TaxID=1970382 RepID=UPI0025BC39EB|nr:potassium-transporting ATPase subunit KdpC [Halothiobacillus sp. 15-55-196]